MSSHYRVCTSYDDEPCNCADLRGCECDPACEHDVDCHQLKATA